MTHIYKYENCPKCKAELTQSGYDGQWCKCGWSALQFKAANDEYLAYLEAAVRAAGFEIKHDGGALADSNFRIEPIIKHGMADQALAGEIVAAVLRDEQDGGCDLSAGMFGKSMTALIRRITSVYLAPPAPGIDVAGLRAFIDDLDAEYQTLVTSDNVLCQKLANNNRRVSARLLALIDASPKNGSTDAKDAARYRWLRLEGAWAEDYLSRKGAVSALFVSDGRVGHATDGDALDAAIDAAMQATSAERKV